MRYDRREFISFLGKVGLGALITPPFLIGCGNTTSPMITNGNSKETLDRLKKLVLKGLQDSDKADILLAEGLNYQRSEQRRERAECLGT